MRVKSALYIGYFSQQLRYARAVLSGEISVFPNFYSNKRYP